MLYLTYVLAIVAVTGAAWFGILVLIDPHRREKQSARSLFVTFLFGFASIPLVILLYSIIPSLGSGEAVYQVLGVGPTEEFAKFFIFFLLVARRKPVQEPLDGMLHAAAVALAFSLVENVKYGLEYGADVIALRTLVSTPAHMTFACIWGFAYSALIHDNPRKRPRDYVTLFFSIYPAALVHGFSNILLSLMENWALLIDGAEFLGAISLLAWLRRKSPFRPFRLADSTQAVQRIETGLSSNGSSFPLHIRAALARAALGDYVRARGHIDRCLSLRKGDAFTIALSGVIHMLQGDDAKGETALRFSYASLTARQKLTLDRPTRHVARSHRTENAYNEFLLSMWMKKQRQRRYLLPRSSTSGIRSAKE